MYKVREYHKTGIQKGNIKQETFFNSFKEAKSYYNAMFYYYDYSLNPTMWIKIDTGYKRINPYDGKII